MNLPAPSAWRYTHHIPDGTISYQYDTARPKNCNHPNYTPMFTQGQLNQYGQACFEEGVSSVHTLAPMTEVADRYAHRMALELECVLADRNANWDRAMNLIGEYRSAMNAIHEQHSPTHMGEPLLHNTNKGALPTEYIKQAAQAYGAECAVNGTGEGVKVAWRNFLSTMGDGR